MIDILWCGVCHSDLHNVRNDWDDSVYPRLPGHEIIGRVAAGGAQVTRFTVGDRVGVGRMVDGCFACDPRSDGEEQYGPQCVDPCGRTDPKEGRTTHDGCSEAIVASTPLSSLAAGFLTGRIDATTEYEASNVRRSVPRFSPEALAAVPTAGASAGSGPEDDRAVRPEGVADDGTKAPNLGANDLVSKVYPVLSWR